MKNNLRPDCMYYVWLLNEGKIPYCSNRNINNDLYFCPCTENCSGYINRHEINELLNLCRIAIEAKDEELMKVLEKYKEAE